MKFYHIHPETGELLGSTDASPAHLDPLETEKQGKPAYMVPAGATTTAPPVTGENEIAVFKSGKWKIEKDRRGEYFDTASGQPQKVDKIGDDPDPAWTDQAPGDATEIWDDQQQAWVPDLQAVIATRQAMLNADLQVYIGGHFDLGSQASFQALYVDANTPATVKADIETVWAWIKTVLSHYYACKNDLAGLTVVDEAKAYAWDFSSLDQTRPAVTLQDIYSVIG